LGIDSFFLVNAHGKEKCVLLFLLGHMGLIFNFKFATTMLSPVASFATALAEVARSGPARVRPGVRIAGSAA
jgi:hypothetical protein